jgi:TPR repeat protein
MSRGRILEVVLTMLGAVLLLIASAGKHPYGFYMALRLVVTVGAVYWAWRVYKAGQQVWTWIFVAVAVLLNPFLPIRMQRTQWQPIDLYLGIFLIGWSGYWLFRKRIREFEIKRLAEKKVKEINGAYEWPGTGDYQKAGISTGGTTASTSTRAASSKRTSSARGWWTDSTLYSIAWTAVCLLLGGSFFLPVSSLDPSWVLIIVFVVIPAGLQAWWTDSALYRITWTVVCLLLGGGFSLAVSSPDSGLGLIIVFALAFGGSACAALLWSSTISKVLSKIGITTFSMRAMICWLIVCAILSLNFVGSLAARSSTPETQLRTSVSGMSVPPVLNQNNASDAGKGAVTNGVSGVSAGCQPPVFSQRVFSALKQQAANGNAEAQCILGDSYYDGQGVPKDDAQAALWWRKAAEQGLADAQNNLGASYDNGEGVPQDYAQAAFWYREAAEQGLAEARYNLGVLYYEEWVGQGVPQDDTQAAFWCRKIRAWRAWINSADPYNRRYTQAVFWFRKAAEQGDADAQDALGNLYYDGHGPLSMQLIMHGHYAQAALWFRKAAEQGDADAQYNLGLLYDDGDGVPQDATEAAAWYSKAADQGDAKAQWSLGGLYFDGQGVPRDYTEAYFWYDRAAAGEQDASDSKQVAKYRDKAASHLTPADLARVQERARKWSEAHQAKPH